MTQTPLTWDRRLHVLNLKQILVLCCGNVDLLYISVLSLDGALVIVCDLFPASLITGASLTDKLDVTLCGTFYDSQTTVNCDVPMPGRFVYITTFLQSKLILCEVEVYAVTSGQSLKTNIMTYYSMHKRENIALFLLCI